MFQILDRRYFSAEEQEGEKGGEEERGVFSATERARKVGREGCRSRRFLRGDQLARISKRPCDLHFISFYNLHGRRRGRRDFAPKLAEWALKESLLSRLVSLRPVLRSGVN